MNRYKVSVNGKQLEVLLLARSSNILQFEVLGRSYEVEVSPLIEARKDEAHLTAINPTPIKQSAAQLVDAEGAIRAPMPGIVVNLLVKVGAEVNAGETVAVIEAMKMENNINAPLSGKVNEIAVKVGQEVNNNQILLKITQK